MRETKIKINQIDYDFDEHGGGTKSVELLSITTAPQPPFPAESRYYNSNENVIYKAIVDNTWENAETFNPEVGVLYTYDNETYLYDGKLNSLFKIGDSTSSSELFIVNKTLPVNTVILDTEIDFSENFLINVYVNGLLQTRDEHYYVENTNIVFTSPYPDEMNVIILYTNSSSVSLRPGNPSETTNYNSLTNKPQINGVTLSGNNTSSELGLEDTLISGTNIKTINGESILGAGDLEIKSGSELNEFVITQEIFNEYKNENDYVDLADIIDSEEITQKVINLNNFNFFLNNLTISNKDLIFKNGNIILDSNGVDGTCDKAITASNCELIFKDCILSAIDCENPTNAVIDLNNSNLLFDNVIADNINFSESKSFIQITGRCEVNIKNSDIELLNNDESEDEPENVLTFIRVLTDNTLIKMMDSIVKIDKPIGSNLRYFEHKMISTAENVDTEIKIINSYLEIEDNYHLPHTHKEYELSNIFDINLDNTDINIINSCINNQSVLRLESKYKFEQDKSFTTEDPHCINIYNNIEIYEYYNEDEEHIFEEINVDEDIFSSIVDYQEGEYIFIYNDSNWTLNDEPVNIEDYGITYTLVEGEELYDGVEIQVYYSKGYQAYKILKDFTVESDNIEDYTQIIKDTIIDNTVPGIEFVRVEDEDEYIDTINNFLEENNYPIDDTYYEEYTYDNDEWHLKLYRIVDENEEVVVEDEIVDLNHFGGAIQIGLDDETPDLVNGMKFTIISQTPYLKECNLQINKCYNSVLAQDTSEGYRFLKYFISLDIGNNTSIFCADSVRSNIIETHNLSIPGDEEGDYFLPIQNNNLESNNVKDAINELADNKQNKPRVFINIEANDWQEDDTFEDYGYKCELECEGVNENMFAQVVFGIEEINSGNYASVCDTAENKVIIYSKVNDIITIPTIVIMEV